MTSIDSQLVLVPVTDEVMDAMTRKARVVLTAGEMTVGRRLSVKASVEAISGLYPSAERIVDVRESDTDPQVQADIGTTPYLTDVYVQLPGTDAVFRFDSGQVEPLSTGVMPPNGGPSADAATLQDRLVDLSVLDLVTEELVSQIGRADEMLRRYQHSRVALHAIASALLGRKHASEDAQAFALLVMEKTE